VNFEKILKANRKGSNRYTITGTWRCRKKSRR